MYGQDGGGDLELFVSWFPKPLARVLRTGVHALLDPPLLAAFGFPQRPAGWSLPATVPFGCTPEWCGPCRRGRAETGPGALDRQGLPERVRHRAARDGADHQRSWTYSRIRSS